MSVSCCAVLAIRNEAVHITRALTAYINQQIDVVVIDNTSTDETISKCKKFLGRGLLDIKVLPWQGSFDLSAQLAAKEAVIQNLSHDWVIHADADEWLQSPVVDEPLIDGIARIAAAGYNVINFEEFVFLPDANYRETESEYQKCFLHYYFFAPRPCRLMRAWQRSSMLRNTHSGGHTLSGDTIRLCPENFILRHYPVLSFNHAVAKYTTRRYAAEDRAKGWHGNRLQLSAERLKLPSPDHLKRLSHWRSREFDRSSPAVRHYWEWTKEDLRHLKSS